MRLEYLVGWEELREDAKIIAIDPGKTTGIAIGYWKPGMKSEEGVEEAFEMTGLGVLSWLHNQWWDRLVVEDFILPPHAGALTKDATETIKMVGAIQAMFDRVQMVPPSQHKSVITEERLDAAGWWIEGEPHARDAVRILLFALRNLAAHK